MGSNPDSYVNPVRTPLNVLAVFLFPPALERCEERHLMRSFATQALRVVCDCMPLIGTLTSDGNTRVLIARRYSLSSFICRGYI